MAARAREFAAAFDSGVVAEWLGWWHDAGKVDEEVQRYLRGETNRERGPDHSSAGMLAAADLGHLWPLAFNVAGHHGGLMDEANDGANNLRARIERKREDPRVVAALEDVRPFLAGQAPEIGAEDVPAFAKHSKHAMELWLRMLHSALVDADWLDTEAFMQPEKAATRERAAGDLTALGTALRDRLEREQDDLIERHRGTTDVNAARAEVYQACLRQAEEPQGVYSLTVPTGGGKTRSVMAFALRHAFEHELRRVVVALPYTSIIEQNAADYRDLLGAEHVLEHHSAVVFKEHEEPTEAERRARLAAENWDAPVVVTTTVQLLESLFASQNRRLRKLHRLARSVIVLDEVQTLPPRLLDPTLDMLRALVRDYGVTLVLCTATPPALGARDGFPGFEDVTEIVPDPKALARRLRRVEYEVEEDEAWDWPRVAAEMLTEPQALAVLNTKKDALALLDALPTDAAALHLSTRLCGAHRRAVLEEVHRRLGEDKPIRLVATQVVEAGVDIDFPLVLRALGPLDRIVQAAGRCNREGKLKNENGQPRLGRVVVFRPAEGGLPPGAYKAGADEALTLIREFVRLDLGDPDTALMFFRRLYGVLELDQDNVQGHRRHLRFEQTARAYRLIREEDVPVVVRYDADAEAAERREAVLREVERKGFADRDDFRALQPFAVGLREREHQQAVGIGDCYEVVPGVWRWTGGYDAGPDGRSGRGLNAGIPLLTDRAEGTVL